jgi:AraC-like DNA-binding protein
MSRTIANTTPPVLEKRDAPRGIITPPDGDRPRPVRYHASADLAVFVEHYWIVSWDLQGKDPRVQETLPHPSIHLAVEAGRSAIFGVMKGKFSRTLSGTGRVFAVKFRPGGFHPFLRSPLSRLTNRTIPIAEIFGPAGQAFETAILSQTHDAEMVATTEDFLRARTPVRDAAAETIGRIVEYTAADHEMTTVDALVRKFGLGKRSLQRQFAQYIGVSPKWVINRSRLHEAIALVDSGETIDWTRLAADLGYFDQAHFIRDFKAIIGESPGEYARRSRP